jgi:hypothetical protein
MQSIALQSPFDPAVEIRARIHYGDDPDDSVSLYIGDDVQMSVSMTPRSARALGMRLISVASADDPVDPTIDAPELTDADAPENVLFV